MKKKNKKKIMIKIMMTITLEIYSAAEQALVLKRDFADPLKLNSTTSKELYTKQVSRFSPTPFIVYSVILSTRAMISALFLEPTRGYN
jgi:hypothetical protein